MLGDERIAQLVVIGLDQVQLRLNRPFHGVTNSNDRFWANQANLLVDWLQAVTLAYHPGDRRPYTFLPILRVLMTKIDDNDDRVNRIGRIHTIVQEDYERICSTDDPLVVLNLKSGAEMDQVNSRYERYERFYRAENFQRLGDMELTRKALDIRRAIGRAMVEIQTIGNTGSSNVLPVTDEVPALPPVDADSAAFGDVYYRDGLTFMRLGDFDGAFDCFQRASDFDPSRGIIIANLAYTHFKRRSNDPSLIDDTNNSLHRAARLEPGNAEIFVLLARFAINCEKAELAREAIARIEDLQPSHPRLSKLRERARD